MKKATFGIIVGTRLVAGKVVYRILCTENKG
jgi:hypothetical protein